MSPAPAAHLNSKLPSQLLHVDNSLVLSTKKYSHNLKVDLFYFFVSVCSCCLPIFLLYVFKEVFISSWLIIYHSSLF